MNTAAILTFLSELTQHNDRDWFHAHKADYQQAAAEFEALVQALMLQISEFDDSIPLSPPRELTFKLQRDTRFSHDKSPYNPAFRAHIAPRGKLPIPVGYYLCIRPGDRSFLGGGLFTDMFRDATAMIREAISQQSGEWDRILQAPDFRAYFTLQGTTLKKVPRGYAPDHPQAQYLKHKSWYLEYPIPDHILAEPETFLPLALDRFRRMKPFQDFLNRALADFHMPAR